MIILVEKSQFQEKRIPATQQEFNKLQAQIETNPMLKQQLTARMGDIDQYRYLYFPGWQSDMTLFRLLELIVQEDKESILEFIKSGEQFTGFIAYKDTGKKIWAVKMASFFNDQKKANRQLIADLIDFAKDKLSNRNEIEWWAEKGNPANLLYRKAIPEKFPRHSFSYEWDAKMRRFKYSLKR